MQLCPCGSNKIYSVCCGLYLDGKFIPETPEQLMRSRYTAYSLANIDYIKKTMCGKALVGFNPLAAEHWAKKILWIGLQVMNTPQETPEKGYVEFIATFLEEDKLDSIHEISEFHRLEGRWFYVDGMAPNVSSAPSKQKIMRNHSCPCGSQKKFKNCHGNAGRY
ncbi:YchJ family protein [Legionella septentrionalis]|uniref:YchJ family protein n=1 Tax=Legionella septentrionalis TaxID=2498109 RepID=UPI000F8DB957|nr:YchJ family protein [Legionella septentrionalis]RUR13713.1 YchJ family protein [Legionella septentrionalis]